MRSKVPHVAILQNEVPDDHVLWVRACAERAHEITWEVVDLTRADWFERMCQSQFDAMLATPPGWNTAFRILFDERLTILHRVLGIPVYPSFEEIQIYENKKYLSYWLKARGIPHPPTWVFYYRDEALDWLRHASFPLVAKTSIGGGGSGVVFLKDEKAARRYIENVFSGRGTSPSRTQMAKKGVLNARAAQNTSSEGIAPKDRAIPHSTG